MPVRAEQKESGPGWGCSCKAFRLGEPTPGEALAALARSETVTVEDRGAFRDGTRKFWCWTDPADRYEVTHDPAHPGGWCKHILATMVAFAPWHRQLAVGAARALDELHEARKEIKKRERRINTLERKLK